MITTTLRRSPTRSSSRSSSPACTLVLKTQAHDFTVEGNPVDPKQCIERIVAANGTFYTDCKKP
jgi:hypothetical protein